MDKLIEYILSNNIAPIIIIAIIGAVIVICAVLQYLGTICHEKEKTKRNKQDNERMLNATRISMNGTEDPTDPDETIDITAKYKNPTIKVYKPQKDNLKTDEFRNRVIEHSMFDETNAESKTETDDDEASKTGIIDKIAKKVFK